ncbi:PKD-like family lipoprotein [Pedobacter africanus]|uniref:PKD-like family protein n=1 Tax=Pedobacter africanus TaxID=151894 RepID=A0A1W2AVV6_9SPHI|nr:PKD-like family lipoprotein [Pedobacter africanus]SMC64813.1 PKD-like family protein [Pedobacter africanus]
MFTKIHTYLIALAIILAYSCKKDLGNYDYKSVNEVQQFGGVNDTTAVYGSQFTIKPILSFTADNGADTTKYSYEWAYVGPNGLGGDKMFVLATTRNLNVKMTLVARAYTFYYGVTDKASGVKYRKKFTLTVQNEINEGWFLMTDVNGTARLDVISRKSDGSFVNIIDLLKVTESGLTLKGKPVMAYTYPTGLLIGPDAISYGLYLGTDQGTTKIDPNTYKWTKTMDLSYEMFGEIPVGFYAQAMKARNNSSAYMLGKGNVYLYDRPVNVYYATPINYIDAEKKGFTAAPFLGSDETSPVLPLILYDSDNRRFVKHSGTAASCTTLPEPAADKKLFSFSTGMDLLYMEFVRFNGTEVFAILKQPTGTKRFLARFNISSNEQSYYAEILATDFDKAEQYAISPDLAYVFYNVGSKVYEYDIFLKTTKLVVDKGTNRVSLIKFHVFRSTTKYPEGNKLIVCSYDPALPEGINGKMELFTVPPLNADLQLYKSFSGFGKVQSLTYRER